MSIDVHRRLPTRHFSSPIKVLVAPGYMPHYRTRSNKHGDTGPLGAPFFHTHGTYVMYSARDFLGSFPITLVKPPLLSSTFHSRGLMCTSGHRCARWVCSRSSSDHLYSVRPRTPVPSSLLPSHIHLSTLVHNHGKTSLWENMKNPTMNWFCCFDETHRSLQ